MPYSVSFPRQPLACLATLLSNPDINTISYDFSFITNTKILTFSRGFDSSNIKASDIKHSQWKLKHPHLAVSPWTSSFLTGNYIQKFRACVAMIACIDEIRRVTMCSWMSTQFGCCCLGRMHYRSLKRVPHLCYHWTSLVNFLGRPSWNSVSICLSLLDYRHAQQCSTLCFQQVF